MAALPRQPSPKRAALTAADAEAANMAAMTAFILRWRKDVLVRIYLPTEEEKPVIFNPYLESSIQTVYSFTSRLDRVARATGVRELHIHVDFLVLGLGEEYRQAMEILWVADSLATPVRLPGDKDFSYHHHTDMHWLGRLHNNRYYHGHLHENVVAHIASETDTMLRTIWTNNRAALQHLASIRQDIPLDVLNQELRSFLGYHRSSFSMPPSQHSHPSARRRSVDKDRSGLV